jgi:hypothetical protein
VGVSFRNTVKSLFLIPATANSESNCTQSEVLSNGAVSIEAIDN